MPAGLRGSLCLARLALGRRQLLQLAERAMVKNVVSRFLWNCLPAATSRLSWKDVVARLQAGRPGKSGRQTTFHAWRQAGQAGPQIAKRRSPRFGHVVSTSKLTVTSLPTCHGSVSSDGTRCQARGRVMPRCSEVARAVRIRPPRPLRSLGYVVCAFASIGPVTGSVPAEP